MYYKEQSFFLLSSFLRKTGREHEATEKQAEELILQWCWNTDVCVFVCEVLAQDSSCPLGFANVALPPLQQHGTVSVFVVKLAVYWGFVCVCALEREVTKNNQVGNEI